MVCRETYVYHHTNCKPLTTRITAQVGMKVALNYSNRLIKLHRFVYDEKDDYEHDLLIVVWDAKVFTSSQSKL